MNKFDLALPIWDQLAAIGRGLPDEVWAELEAQKHPGEVLSELRSENEQLRAECARLREMLQQVANLRLGQGGYCSYSLLKLRDEAAALLTPNPSALTFGETEK